MIGTRLLDRYELTSELGRGGMGIVYRAHDPVLDREVAVKVIPQERLNPQTEERFQREARLVAAMDHPAIVPIHDFGRHEGSLFFVMPWVQGHPLRQDIRRGSLALTHVLDVAIQVAEALDYSHARGVVHRDVKPDNIMVLHDAGRPRVRVMDFGLAQGSGSDRWNADGGVPGTGGLPGTLAYLSPEQVASADLDGRSDIYSLGTVIYECLGGKPPFEGTLYPLLYSISNEDPQPLCQLGVTIHEDLDALILRCLAKRPEDRPQRGRELAEELRAHRLRLEAGGSPKDFKPPPEPAAFPTLIGRDAEISAIAERLEAAQHGGCRVVVVGGDAGVGKSRLLEEAAEAARRLDVPVLRGRIADRNSTVAFQGLCELIQDYFRQRKNAATASDAGPPLPELTDLAGDLVDLFPVLSEIPELRAASRVAAEAVEDMTEPLPLSDFSGRSMAVFELLARTLARLAANEPMLLILEDLHAGEASIEALRYVLHRLGATPLLVLGSYRTEEVERQHPLAALLRSLQDDPKALTLQLSPLTPTDLKLLLATELGVHGNPAGLSQDVVDRLHEATEGNPCFALELVRSLRENGDLAQDDEGAWHLRIAPEAGTHALPATIQQAVEGRIERLSEQHRKILSVAAVLGRRFEFNDLEDLLAEGDAEEVDEAVDALVRQGLLVEEKKRRGDWLAFASGVIRDVLYQEMSRRRRKSLHRQHAFRLEERHRGHPERFGGRLLKHFYLGGVAERAVTYSLQLASASLKAASPEDAIQAAQIGLEMVEDVADPPRAEGELRKLLAGAYREAGQYDESLAQASRAVDAFADADAPDRLAATALVAAETAWRQRRIDDVGRWVDRGLEPARQSHADASLRKLLTFGATVANLRGQYDVGQGLLAEAEELARLDPSRSTGTGSTEGLPVVGGTLSVAFRMSVRNIDPAGVKTIEEQEIAANVFETLIVNDGDGNLMPWLCRQWQSRDEETCFHLQLREEVRFSDGSPLRAADVKTALEETARRCSYSPPEALTCLRGIEDFLAGRSPAIEGIQAAAERELRLRLKESLPIFPALLSDPKTAVYRRLAGELGMADRFLGTGPFRLMSSDTATAAAKPYDLEHIVLHRDPGYWREYPATLDRVEFLTGLDGAAIATGLRTGKLDVGRDLLPEDLEEFLRDLRYRRRLAEATMNNVYFLLFNKERPIAQQGELREALAVSDSGLVWSTLGRFAQPASSFVPPGILGHDPGRRWSANETWRAKEKIRLRGAIHPILRDRFGTFLDAFFAAWADRGVTIENVTPTMREYLSAWGKNEGIDFLLGRWNGEFDDPDSYTFGLFHSRYGKLRLYHGTEQGDELLEKARRERDSTLRCELYRRFESNLAREAMARPLFYDVDYRLARPVVRGLRLRSSRPYVQYADISLLTRSRRQKTYSELASGGEIYTALAAVIDSLDPVAADAIDQEASSTIFETLTRIDQGARTIPWLAASLHMEDGGTSYRVTLRPNIRFHDGRRLTARDVRFSFERALRRAPRPLLPLRGTAAFRQGDTDEIAGFKIVSSHELVLELDKPLSYFPALLSQARLAILPEGTLELGADWRNGCVGSGPFRVVHFKPGERLDLEKNSHYWRPARPKSDRLLFYLGVDAARIYADFRKGRLSLAAGLRPVDVEALCHDPNLAGGYHESPRLATAFLAFNTRRGPFANHRLRRGVCTALEVTSPVRETMGRLATVAGGLIPPGLLGAEARRRPTTAGFTEEALSGLRVRAAVADVFLGAYADFWQRMAGGLKNLGIQVEAVPLSRVENLADHDVVLDRWEAAYPDADSFAMGLLHTEEGYLGHVLGHAAIDALAERGRYLADPAQRHLVYRELEEELARQGVLLPLFHEHAYRFCQPQLKGLRVDFSLPGVRYEDLSAAG